MQLPVAIAFLFGLVVTIPGIECGCITKRPCNIAYRCSDEEIPVWAVDLENCYVFRNECLLLSENCSRLNNYLPELVKTTKEKCQCLCDSVCPANYYPICGLYNGKNTTFANQCEMDKHICKTGQTYSRFSFGPCT